VRAARYSAFADETAARTMQLTKIDSFGAYRWGKVAVKLTTWGFFSW
jgi:hypothetical protein